MTLLPPRTPVRRRWRTLLALSAASFIDGGEDQALAILWPSMRKSLAASVGELGWVLGVGQAVSTVLLPVWGWAADRFSRKKLLVVFTGFWGLWTLALGLVDGVRALVLVRVLSTVGLGAFVPAAFSLLGDLFDHRDRGRATGVMTAIGMAGMVCAFGLLPWIADRGPEAWRWGFFALGGASALTGFLMLLVLAEPRRGEREAGAALAPARPQAPGELRGLLRIRTFWWLLASEVLGAVGPGLLSGWAFTWLADLGLGSSAFAVVGTMFLATLASAPLAGWAGDLLEGRHPERGRLRLMLAGLVLTMPAAVLLLTLGEHGVVALTAAGMAFGLARSVAGSGVSWPIGQAILPPTLRGRGQAMIAMARGAASALALPLSGLAADHWSVTEMLIYLVPLPALLQAVAWLPVLFTYGPDRRAAVRWLAAGAGASRPS